MLFDFTTYPKRKKFAFATCMYNTDKAPLRSETWRGWLSFSKTRVRNSDESLLANRMFAARVMQVFGWGLGQENGTESYER